MPEVLRYSGKLENVDYDRMFGPDVGRRYLAIKSVDYDPETDITTITLRAIMPDEFRERVGALVKQQRERERIRKVFGR